MGTDRLLFHCRAVSWGWLEHRTLDSLRQPLQKPSFRAFWRVADAVAGTGNAGWTASKSGHPCPCQNCSQWPPAEKKKKKLEKDLCWIVPHVPPTTQSSKGLNWTEYVALTESMIVKRIVQFRTENAFNRRLPKRIYLTTVFDETGQYVFAVWGLHCTPPPVK